jgi:hypothetical protein
MRISLLVLCLISTEAIAHQAPSGWYYDGSCCSNKDCMELPDGQVKETPKGYLIVTSKEIIPYSDARIKKSGDEHFHRCNSTLGTTRCLYVPSRGF